jgi:hypothetical protein
MHVVSVTRVHQVSTLVCVLFFSGLLVGHEGFKPSTNGLREGYSNY